jgi:hypothetical protein
MTRKILTYQAPTQLFRSDSLFQKQYADCLHIVATNSLKSGLGESIKGYKWIHAPIITFSELFSELSGTKWSSTKAQLEQFLQLSDIFSNLWDKDSGKNRLTLQAMERNQMQVLKTLRTLTELGLSSTDINPPQKSLSSSERIFFKIWSNMQAVLDKDAQKLERFLSEDRFIKRDFEKALNEWVKTIHNKKEPFKTIQRQMSNLPRENSQKAIDIALKKKKIIVHGFYFITPIQQCVFNQLEKSFELIFLNTYDENYPNTFEPVKHFLGIDKLQTDCTVKERIPVHPLAAKLLETFEGGSKININETATVYNDLPHFIEAESKILKQMSLNKAKASVKDLEEVSEQDVYHLLTPRAKEVEEQLVASGFVPSTGQKLTEYPVGRFLYRLHQMRVRNSDLESGTVTFDENVTPEIILDCFASGCLIVNKENMLGYVKSLEKILPYCSGITTFKKWYSQLQELVHEKEKWEKELLNENKMSLSNRIHKFHAFPMRQLSYFSVDVEEINNIVLGIKRLEKIHTTLFSEWQTKKVDMATHLRTVERLVLKSVEEHFENAEKEIVRKIIDDISKLKDDELEFTLKDISKGLLFYLDGSLEELGDPEFVVDRVFAFDSADAAPFRLNRKFHLAFADQKSLPISQEFNLWPISRELLLQFEKLVPDLRLLEERKIRHHSISRYLLYVLFSSAQDIRFSYVENLGKESRLELALYLKLLDCKISKAPRDYSKIKTGKKEETIDINLDSIDYWTISMKREAQVCPKRGSFSFILNEHTTFKSDFHQGFLYENYIVVLNQMLGKNITYSDMRKKVNQWFPQWNDMKKDFLYEHITTRWGTKPLRIKRDSVKVKKVEYSQGISYFNLLPLSYGSKDKNTLIPVEDVKLHQASSGKHCTYCPYLSICRDGMYQLDIEEENN